MQIKNKKYCKTVTEHFLFTSPHYASFLNLLFCRVNYYQWLYIYTCIYTHISPSNSLSLSLSIKIKFGLISIFLIVSIDDNYVNNYSIYDTISNCWLVLLSITSSLDSVVNKDLTSLDPVSAPPTPPLPLFSSLHL